MYVDKVLGGVNAVQTLLRLNRTHPQKEDTAVLDFANRAEDIQKAFEPYYETTLLSESTDPALLYDLERLLREMGVYTAAEVEAFAQRFYKPKTTQAQLYAQLAPIVVRVAELHIDDQRTLRSLLTDYVRLYSFLAQVLPFTDTGLEKLYLFVRHLRRLIKVAREELPVEIQQNIDMESYRLQQTSQTLIKLKRGVGQLDPQGVTDPFTPNPEHMEPLSQIIAELNERFGLNLGEEHRVTIGYMLNRLYNDAALEVGARANMRDAFRLTFDRKVGDGFQEIVDSNFDLYKRITDDPAFGEMVKSWLFDQYMRAHRSAADLIRQRESKTLEFKSSLRWDIKQGVKDDRIVTHAVLKTIAAFLNTEGGDLLIGVADDGAVVGIEVDQFESDDKFMLHLAQVVRNGLGVRASTCIDPKTERIDGKTVCVVICQRSPEPVYLRWKDLHKTPEGDFYVRSGPGTVRLEAADIGAFVRTLFGG